MSRTTVIAASLIIGISVTAAAAWKVYTLGRTAGALAVQAQWDKATAQQNELVKNEIQKLQGVKDAALKESNTRAQRNAVAAQSARGELDRLRDTIAAHGARTGEAATCPTTDAPNPLAAVLNECAGELEAMARHADGHLNDSLTLFQAQSD